MMKGETILSGAEKNSRVSDFKVMKSGAGWYVGTTYREEEGYEVPNTRETGYFRSEAEAAAALKEYNETGWLPNSR